MRIGIVNDLEIALEVLKKALAKRPDNEILWVARTGKEAVQFANEASPDVILMDLVMPEMNGAEATRSIMESAPTAIIVVTSSVGSHASLVFDAMGYGALDAINTPTLGDENEVRGADLLQKKIDMIARLKGKKAGNILPLLDLPGEGSGITERARPPLVAIGASTGGPKVLSEILGTLPDSFAGSVVIVQHVDQQFAPGLAAWLSEFCSIKVQVAAGGEWLEQGGVYLAGTNDHLIMGSGGHLRYTARPESSPYRPSVDVFFNSLAQRWPTPGMAVLLTGMGKDGALGLKALRAEGWRTVVQDEASSVVYGMPKAALVLNAAQQVLDPRSIGEEISRFFAKYSAGGAHA